MIIHNAIWEFCNSFHGLNVKSEAVYGRQMHTGIYLKSIDGILRIEYSNLDFEFFFL